jgi:hypothetical protein
MTSFIVYNSIQFVQYTGFKCNFKKICYLFLKLNHTFYNSWDINNKNRPNNGEINMSNHLDFSVDTREKLKRWIVLKMGGLVTIEISEDELEMCIDDSLEVYTEWVSMDVDYLAVDLSEYVEDYGIKLPNNVKGVSKVMVQGIGLKGGINNLFTVANQMMNSGDVAYPLHGSSGGTWLNYDMSKRYMKMFNKMMGNFYHHEYVPQTQIMKLSPDPTKGRSDTSNLGHAVCVCHTIRDEELLYGEQWVKKYALALAKEQVGRNRSKFKGTSLLGGGEIDNSILEEGKIEQEKLMEDIQARGGIIDFFVG